MHKPRAAITSIIIAAISIIICFSISRGARDVLAQQSQQPLSADTVRGIKLYKQGDTKGAINALRAAVKQQKDDALAWYYLGLALNVDGNTKDSRKAFETTVKLRPEMAGPHVSLAYLLLLTDKTGEAVREAERALRV